MKKAILLFALALGNLSSTIANNNTEAYMGMDNIVWQIQYAPDANNILYVDKTATGNGSGSSWANAIPELADALKWAKQNEDPNWATTPLQIWVADGTYKPLYSPRDGANFADEGRVNTFLMVNNTQLYGGFDPANGIDDLTDTRIFGAGGTVLSGNIGTASINTDNAYHVLISSGAMGNAILDGFVITQAFSDINNPSTITINGNNFLKSSGGGLYSMGSNFEIVNVRLTGNQVIYRGGGVYANTSQLDFRNVSIDGNVCGNNGRAILADDSTINLVNSTITDNTNSSGNSDHSLVLYGTTVFNGDNTIVFGGRTSYETAVFNFQYSFLEGNSDTSNGNINTTGLTAANIFVDPANGNYTLKPTSPAINAGSNTLYETTDGNTGNNSLTNNTDLAGNPRLYDGTPTTDVIDLGAYELQQDFIAPIAPDANNILYVDKTATGNGSGSSWTDAIPELADALKWANDNGPWITANPLKIYVAKGTYKPLYSSEDGMGFGTNQGRVNSFLMVNNVQLYGGFDGTETTFSQRDPSTNVCILSGDLNGDDGSDFTNRSDNAYQVVVSSGDVGTGLLDGFTISGGDHSVSPFIVKIRGNDFLRQWGAGMAMVDSSPQLINLKFTDNSGVAGAAIFAGGNSSPDLTNLLIVGNQCSTEGILHVFDGASPILTNVTIADNTILTSGPVMANNQNAFYVIHNSIVYGNMPVGSALFGTTNGQSAGGPNLVSYSLLEGQSSTANGNLDGTDLNYAPDFTNPTNGDYTLQSTSPAINAGSNSEYEAADGNTGNNNLSNDLDLAGNPRVFDFANSGTIDMGAFEFQGQNADYVYENGAWTPSNPNTDPADATDNVLVVNGTTVFTENISVNNITINIGATLNIENAITLNGELVNNGNIVFRSDDGILGQLGDMTGIPINGSGSVTVERHIHARDDGKGAYRYLASSVNSSETIHNSWQEGASSMGNPNPGFGMFITGAGGAANGFDETEANAPSLFRFDNMNQEYVPITNTDENQFIAGIPYSVYVWGDRSVDIVTSNDPIATSTTLRSIGQLVTGDQTTSNLSQVSGGFSLVGNPYQAIVDMNNVLPSSNNLNTNLYYIWDPNLGMRGANVTVDLAMATTTPSTSDANQYVMPGQAFWVVTAADQPGTLITFQEMDKAVIQSETDVFKTQTEIASIELQLFQADRYANGQSLSDALLVNFTEDGDNDVLSNDAPKMYNMDETIARVHGNALLSIENRAFPIDGETLPLLTDQYRTTDYVFNAVVANLPTGTKAYLLDNYLGTQTELANNVATPVGFGVDANIAASIATDRFSFVFSKNTMSMDDNLLTDGLSIYPNPVKNGQFFIAAPGLSGQKVQVSLYNILGQKVYVSAETVNSNNRVNVPTTSLETGVYLVEMIHNGDLFTGKAVIKL